jgi:hypothetical protein
MRFYMPNNPQPDTNSVARKAYWFYYKEPDDSGLIRIRARKKPSRRARPYAVQEFCMKPDGRFAYVMPCFPEIAYSRLSKMTFIGKELAA